MIYAAFSVHRDLEKISANYAENESFEERKNRIMDKQGYKKLLLDYTKKAYSEKLFTGTSGNLSIYDRKENCIYITPSSTSYETMTVDDIVIINPDGDILEGDRAPSSEWRLHVAIYKQRKEVTSVVHTHSPYATAFAVADMQIPIILIEMVPFIGDSIQVAKFAIPGDEEVGQEAVKAMKGRKGCLLQNHGAVAAGENIESAYNTAVYIEDSAKIYYLSSTVGNAKVISDEQVEKFKLKLNMNVKEYDENVPEIMKKTS